MDYENTTESALRELLGNPVHGGEEHTRLTEPLQRYIERSPFACLATHGADDTCDLSPRGDPPGFVKVLDERTLFLPERPGNNRLDSIINIVDQPQLSLLFMIPETRETVRVNGTRVVTTDPELLALCPVRGRLPTLGVLIAVREAFGHCSKALRRARLRQDDYATHEGVPTLAEMMSSHVHLDAALSAQLDEGIENDVRTRMY